MASAHTFTLPPDVAAYLAALQPGQKSGTVAEAIRQSPDFRAWAARQKLGENNN